MEPNLDKKKRQLQLFTDICLRFAQESHCLSKKVCALAVRDGRIICTGINGTAPETDNCDKYFRKYFKENYILRKHGLTELDFNQWIETMEFRELHHQWSLKHELHAEQNLVAQAARLGISLADCDIYISLSPCISCTRLLIGLHPKNVYYIEQYDKGDSDFVERFEAAGISCRKISDLL